jgi:hypothetical protein
MDTTNPQPQQVPGSQIGASSQPHQSAVPHQPQTPISGGNKEAGPIGTGRVSEYVTPHPTETAPTLPQEVSGVVEASSDVEKPNVSEEVRQAGVTPAKESTPVPSEPQVQTASQTVPLPTPMNYEQAKKEVSHGNPNNSKTWLGMLSKYVLEKFGMQKAA